MSWVENNTLEGHVWYVGALLPGVPFILPAPRTDLFPDDLKEIDFFAAPAGIDPALLQSSDPWYLSYRYRAFPWAWSSDEVADSGLHLYVVAYHLDYDWPAAEPSVSGADLVPADLADGGSAPPPPTPPSNDDFADAIELGTSGQLAFDTDGATVGQFDGSESIWYAWTAPEDGVLGVAVDGSTVSLSGSGFVDVLLDLNNAGLEGAWQGKATGTFYEGGQIEAVVTVVAGQRYWFRIGAWDAQGVLWWGYPQLSERTERDPVAFDHTNHTRVGWTVSTGRREPAGEVGNAGSTSPLPYETSASSQFAGSMSNPAASWENEWDNRGSIEYPSGSGDFDTHLNVIESVSAWPIWRAASQTFSEPAPSWSSEYVGVAYDTPDGSATVTPDTPVRIRGSVQVTHGWQNSTGGPQPLSQDRWWFQGGGLYQRTTLPTTTAEAIGTSPASLTPLVTWDAIGTDPQTTPEGIASITLPYDLNVDPLSGIALLDAETLDATFPGDPNTGDNLTWAHVDFVPPAGWPDPPFRDLDERFQNHHGSLAAPGPYRVTGTYTPSAYWYVRSIIGRATSPLRMRQRDDGARRYGKAGPSSVQASVRQQGRGSYA